MTVPLEHVVAALRALPTERTRWVGLDGFGGAGKTTTARYLAAALEDMTGGATVVHVDDFAGPDVPEWDWTHMQRQLVDPVRAGRPGCYQVWDWSAHVGGEWVEVPPGTLLLIEGVSATRRELRVPWDVTVWVDAPAPVRRARALERDGAETWPVWEQQWIPAELAYAERERPRERVTYLLDGSASLAGGGHWSTP